jgi:hypothetical protein
MAHVSYFVFLQDIFSFSFSPCLKFSLTKNTLALFTNFANLSIFQFMQIRFKQMPLVSKTEKEKEL